MIAVQGEAGDLAVRGRTSSCNPQSLPSMSNRHSSAEKFDRLLIAANAGEAPTLAGSGAS